MENENVIELSGEDYKKLYEDALVREGKLLLENKSLSRKYRIEHNRVKFLTQQLNTLRSANYPLATHSFIGTFETKSQLTRKTPQLVRVHKEGDYCIVRKDGNYKGKTTKYMLLDGRFVFCYVVC